MRQLKVLVVLLVLSNIGVGAFSYYLLRSVDRRYTELLDRTVPMMNDLQEITARTAETMRATDPVLFQGSAPARSVALQNAQTAFERVQTLRMKLHAEESFLPVRGSRDGFAAAGDAFSSKVAELLQTYGAGDFDKGASAREASVRPAYERYLRSTTKFADELEAESRRLNDSFSAKTSSMSNAVLGVASWPLLVFAGLLLLTGLFVFILMLLFRGRQLADIKLIH